MFRGKRKKNTEGVIITKGNSGALFVLEKAPTAYMCHSMYGGTGSMEGANVCGFKVNCWPHIFRMYFKRAPVCLCVRVCVFSEAK